MTALSFPCSEKFLALFFACGGEREAFPTAGKRDHPVRPLATADNVPGALRHLSKPQSHEGVPVRKPGAPSLWLRMLLDRQSRLLLPRGHQRLM